MRLLRHNLISIVFTVQAHSVRDDAAYAARLLTCQRAPAAFEHPSQQAQLVRSLVLELFLHHLG